MPHLAAAPLSCLVCASPTASSLHFGARSCKACAAFFRRTVAMSMKYACASQPPTDRPCHIHYHLRMICRHCRFLKCVKAGMKRDLVQRRCDAAAAAAATMTATREIKEEPRPASKGHPCEAITPHYLDGFWEPKAEEDNWSQPSTSTSSPHHKPASSTDESPQTSCSSGSCRVSGFDLMVSSDEAARIARYYVRREQTHWERMRILYTDIAVQQLFDIELPECPYELRHLRPLTMTAFKGMVKSCLLACYDHTLGLSGIEQLTSKADKNLLYRYVVMADYVMGTAFLSSRVGLDEGLLVMTDGTYLRMRPLPTDQENEETPATPEARKERELFRMFMPLHVHHFLSVVEPFIALDISFSEYAILKAITTWQLAHFRVSAECRTLCEQQRNLLVAALHGVAIERGCTAETAPIRVGNLLLYLANVMEFTQGDFLSLFFRVTYFDLHDIEPLIRTMCSHVY